MCYHGNEAEGRSEDDGRIHKLAVVVTQHVVNEVFHAHDAQDEAKRLKT